MKRVCLAMTTAAGLTLILLAVTSSLHFEIRASPAVTTRYVSDYYGADTGGCSDAQTPCLTVRYALVQAEDGDTIQVANSYSTAVYTGTLFITESVHLQGGWAVIMHTSGTLIWNRNLPCEAYRTVLDGLSVGRVISITGNTAPTIDCFTITRGNAETMGGDPDGYDAGGGIYSSNAAPIIVNNVITFNRGCDCVTNNCRGGGIYLLNAPATAIISGNLIANNLGDSLDQGRGGGIMLRDSGAQVVHNTVQGNRGGSMSSDGGGIAIVGGSPTIADNEILENTAGTSGDSNGAGIFVLSSTPVTIERNLIHHNWGVVSSVAYSGTGSRGGGIYYTGDPSGVAVIRDNIVYHNVADPVNPYMGEGGGIYLQGLITPSIVSGNTIHDNVAGFNHDGNGGGICVADSEISIIDNRISDNSGTWSGDYGAGGGVYVESGDVLLQGNVITSNHGAFFGWPSTATGLGGGVAISASNSIVRSNLLADNIGTGAEGAGAGGGLYARMSELLIENNSINGNDSSPNYPVGGGGGIYLEYTLAITMAGNRIYENTTSQSGGGIACEGCPSILIRSNSIHNNTAGLKYGGGLALINSDGATLIANQIYSNSATSSYGGGIMFADSISITLDRNTIYGNNGSFGGGVYLGGCPGANVDSNSIYRNISNYGGGIYLYGEGSPPPQLTLVNNMVVDNEAATSVPGVYVKGVLAHMLHTTIARNTGASGEGVYITSGAAALTNTILVSHTIGIYVSSDSTATLEATLFGSGPWANLTHSAGTGSIDHGEVIILADPGFVDPYNGDYHITLGSAGVDMGFETGLSTDIDGDPRVMGPLPDIGADEACRRLFMPLVMRSS